MFIQTEETPNPAALKFLPGRDVLAAGKLGDEAALLRMFSEPQLPGAVLQPPPINHTDLSNELLVEWALRIAEAGRAVDSEPVTDGSHGLGAVEAHADCPF